MDSPLLFAQFDPGLTFLALVVRALDVHQVKVQSLQQSAHQLNTSFTLSKSTHVSVLEWLANSDSPLVALGNTAGKIQVYSPASNAVVSEFDSELNLGITGIHYSSLTNSLWAADNGGNLLEWDQDSRRLTRKINFNDLLDSAEPVSKISSVRFNNHPHLLVGSHNIYLVDLRSNSIVKLFPGHVQPVNTLLPIPGDDDLFATAADGDRFANIYSLTKGSNKAVLVAAGAIQHMSVTTMVDKSVMAVVTESGAIEMFNNPLSFEAVSQTEKSKKKRKHANAVKSRHSDAVVKFTRPETEIRGPQDESLHINAVSLSANLLYVTWMDSPTLPVTDVLTWTVNNEFALSGLVKVEKAKQKVVLPAHAEGGSDVAAAKPYAESQTYVTEGIAYQAGLDEDDEDDETLAEKAQKLIEEQGSEGKEKDTKKKQHKQTAGSLATVLKQALKTNDQELLEQSVLLSRDPTIIQNTIARLPSSLAIVLLDKLAEKLTRQQKRFDELYYWVKWVVIIHGSVLSQIPHVSNKLANLHSIMVKKASGLSRLLELQGRLKLLQQQKTLKKEILNGSFGGDKEEDDPEVEYNEEIDDAEYAGVDLSDDEPMDEDLMVDDYDEMEDIV